VHLVRLQISTIDLIHTGITTHRHRSTILPPQLTIPPRPITYHCETVGIRIMHDITHVDSIARRVEGEGDGDGAQHRSHDPRAEIFAHENGVERHHLGREAPSPAAAARKAACRATKSRTVVAGLPVMVSTSWVSRS